MAHGKGDWQSAWGKFLRASEVKAGRAKDPARHGQFHSETRARCTRVHERIASCRVCVRMIKRFKKQWAVFKKSPPGKRFIAWHERSRRAAVGQGGGWRILRITGAIVCLIFAVIASLVPGVPGFVFLIVGAALLASESRGIARSLDWIELKLRALRPQRWHS